MSLCSYRQEAIESDVLKSYINSRFILLNVSQKREALNVVLQCKGKLPCLMKPLSILNFPKY